MKRIMILLAALLALPAVAAADDFSAALDGAGLAAFSTGDGTITYGFFTNGIGAVEDAELTGPAGTVDLDPPSTGTGSAAGAVSVSAAVIASVEGNPGAWTASVTGASGTVSGPVSKTGESDGGGGGGGGGGEDDCEPGETPYTNIAGEKFCINAVITPPSQSPIIGTEEPCIPDTVCYSGALPGRSEVYVRVIGPRPNGFFWPTIVRFTPSAVLVEVRRVSTGDSQTYELEAAGEELSAVQDREGFPAE